MLTLNGSPTPSPRTGRHAGLARAIATLVVSVVCLLPSLADEPATDGELSLDQVKILLAELDHDRFVIRENASQQLTQAGPEAFDLLAATANDVHPEAAARAMAVLLAKSRDEDQAVAVAALERLAALDKESWPNHRRAAQRRIDGMVEQLAIAEVRKLGGEPREMGANSGGDAVISNLHLGDEWKGGSEGFQHIVKLKSLRILSIYYVDISDAAIASLAELRGLQQIRLFGTDATLEGVAKLQAKLPNTDIEYRRGALLGVRGSIAGVGNGAIIDEVTPDSAAARAGLRPGDTITKVNGEAIGDFTALTKHISRYKPSDKAKFTIVRNGKPIEVEIEFGRWRVGLFER